MDTLFGIGSGELILILILAGLVLGPHRVQTIARKLGKFTAQMQAISRGFVRQINAELDATGREELALLRQQVTELQEEMKGIGTEIKTTLDETTAEAKVALPKQEDFDFSTELSENSIAPPQKIEKPAETDKVEMPAKPVETPAESIVEEPAKPNLPKPVAIADDPEI